VIKPFFDKVAYHIQEFGLAVATCAANVESWKKVQAGSHVFATPESIELAEAPS
jgi:hypothetical protein